PPRGRAARQVVGPAYSIRAGIARAVTRAMPPGGLVPDLLHDVDLATPWPSHSRDVVTQHPERRPQPLPARNLHACLDPAVLPRAQPLRLEPRRGVRLVAERLAPCLNHQVAVFESRVLDPIGIELDLAGPPAGAPRLAHPFPGGERR